MRVKPVALVLVVALGLGALPGWLQAGPRPQGSTGGDPDLLHAEELPVSLARIRRKLEEAPPSHTFLLRLEVYVEVVGKAPAFHIFEGFDLHTGPVPYGAPTHSDMMRHVTPQEFRTPGMSSWGRARLPRSRAQWRAWLQSWRSSSGSRESIGSNRPSQRSR